jgi:hypothetical protein
MHKPCHATMDEALDGAASLVAIVHLALMLPLRRASAYPAGGLGRRRNRMAKRERKRRALARTAER